MTTFIKLATAAAALTISATSAFAVTAEQGPVPSSLATSALVQDNNVESVTVFGEHVAPSASLNPVVIDQLKDGQTTAIASTLEGQIPASLAGSRLLQN